MADVLYVGLQDDDKIVTFGVDAGAAKLVPRAETPAVGAPSVFAVSPDRRSLYVGYRGTPGIESCRIDSASGALTSLGRVATEHPPTYLAADRAGRYLLSAYYQGAYAAVHPLGSDGAVSGPALDRQNTAPGAHAILTDPSNRFAFVPHIARQQDNVLEPPKNIPGPNFIAQFRFDAATGRLQDVVVLPGDVRHEGEAVRRVGQDRVRSGRGVLPVERRPAHRTIASERVHGRVRALVVGRQEVFAGAVGREIGRRMLGRDAPQRRQGTAGRVDATALDARGTAIADVQDAPVGAHREDRRRAGGRRLGPGDQLAVAAVDTEADDRVSVLQAHVQHVRHAVPPVALLWIVSGHYTTARAALALDSSCTTEKTTSAVRAANASPASEPPAWMMTGWP